MKDSPPTSDREQDQVQAKPKPGTFVFDTAMCSTMLREEAKATY